MKVKTDHLEDGDFGYFFLEPTIEYIQLKFPLDRIYSEEVILKYVSSNFQPENVFDDEELKNWAADNGYIKSEEA